MTTRGSICRADLGEARGSGPARRRPVLVIQSGPFNASRLNTIIVAAITPNTTLAAMPGNVFLPAAVSGLPKDSVVNVTALVTLDKTDLDEPVGQLTRSVRGRPHATSATGGAPIGCSAFHFGGAGAPVACRYGADEAGRRVLVRAGAC